GPVLGSICVSWLSTTAPLIRCISRNRYITRFGQSLSIKSRGLLLYTSVGVCYRYCRIFLRWIIIRRCINIRSNFNSIQYILNWLYVYFSFFLLTYVSFVFQFIGIRERQSISMTTTTYKICTPN